MEERKKELHARYAANERALARLHSDLNRAGMVGAITYQQREHSETITREIAETEAAMKQIAAEVVRLEEKEAEKQQLVADAERRSQVEDAAFWFRRFNTSLAIAHGAAFAALGSNLFDKDITPEVAGAALYPMAHFAIGMLFAGAIPIAVMQRHMKVAAYLAGISATLFAFGILAAVFAIKAKAGFLWLWQM